MQTVDDSMIEAKRDENSFAIFQHTAKNITSIDRDVFYCSPTFSIHGMTWSIGYKVHRSPDHSEGVFDIFIFFKGTANSSRPMVKMEVELKLVNYVCSSKTVREEFVYFYNTSEKGYGFKQFIPWQDVICQNSGFVKEDQIVIEVRLAATPPQPAVEGTCMLFPNDFFLVKSLRESKDKIASHNLAEETLLARELKNCSRSDRGNYLLTSGVGSDCEFLVGEDENQKTFQANSIILARVSPVFESMFFGELRPTVPVEVPDIETDAFSKMLQFAYGCDFEFGSQEEIMDLYYVADKYLIADLQIACLKRVWPTNENDVWPAWHIATFYGLPSLLTAALEVVRQKIDAVLKHPKFCALSANSLLTLVQVHDLKVSSELELFQAVLRWASASCLRKGIPANPSIMREELKDILPYIRFLSMSEREFAKDPVTSGLLTTEEKLQCLLTIFLPSLHDPSPTLCALRRPRRV